MSVNNFHSSLATLLPVENIPDNLGFIKGGINSVFKHLTQS